MAAGAREAARPIDWKAAAISTVRYLLFGLVLPLAAIHIWLATAREGLGSAVKRVGGIIGRAFSPQSVLDLCRGLHCLRRHSILHPFQIYLFKSRVVGNLSARHAPCGSVRV